MLAYGLLLAVCVVTAAAVDASCYAMVGGQALRDPKAPAAVSCPANADPNACFMMCGLCTTPDLQFGMSEAISNKYCMGQPTPDADTVASIAYGVITNVSAVHGYYWLDGGGSETNASECMTKLLRFMPKRDMILLFSRPVQFIDFLVEHVRYALWTWPWASARGVAWDMFTENVLPYAILDEKRDLEFRWRPRFYQLLQPLVATAPNITAAMQAVVAAIPVAQASGVLGLGLTAETLVPGAPVTWRSETSPAYLSPEQTIKFGASCTGTGILLVAAARSVGIPARLAGCSESIVRGDDHHWSEFCDPFVEGPFGDGFQTVEGVSAGNAHGPWNKPSEPMNGCLKGVVPGSNLDTLWATSWSSTTFLPTLWASSEYSSVWSFVGGINRCGAYCAHWGCGVNQTDFWTQSQCGPRTSPTHID